MSESVLNDRDRKNMSSLEWNDQGQPISSTFHDVYFSPKNGLEESRYVFLEGNHLQERFSQLTSNEVSTTSLPQHFTIGEIGFGTGLNFLSCWQLWKRYAPINARMTFISVEKYPLAAEDLARSFNLWPELTKLSQTLVKAYKQTIAPHLSSQKTLTHSPFYTLEFDTVRLILIIDDAETALKNSLFFNTIKPNTVPTTTIDAWFLDGFTPSRNPDMWSQSLFETMRSLSHNNTSLATFTAASHVRKDLTKAGFNIKKRKGFGKKREMLIGCAAENQAPYDKDTSSTQTTSTKKIKSKKNRTPWAVNRHHRSIKAGETVAIIGGGLAGCHTAYSLAKRNINTLLIDAHNTLASQASGNPQGIIYGKLSAHEQILNDFNLSSLLYAQQHYAHFWQAHPDSGQACGVLQLSQTTRAQAQHALIGQQFSGSNFLHYLSREEASNTAGVNLKHPALFFPHCGWLAPQKLCEWLSNNKHIKQVNNTCIDTIQKRGKQWYLSGIQATANTHLTAKIETGNTWQQNVDYVIIANANAAQQLALTEWVPTKPIRGQISYIPSKGELTQLSTVVCSEGYIAPSTDIKGQTQHAIGASYNLNDTAVSINPQDHEDNLQQLNQALSLSENTRELIEAKEGRVGFRCTTPDYLPLAGPVPNIHSFKEDYSHLIKNAHTPIDTEGDYHQGLYLNIGHGSRGLAYTPLTAELLACTLTGEPLPLSQTMADALNPARFIIRDLCRTNIPPKHNS